MYPIVTPTLTPAQCMLLKKGDVPCFDLLRDFDFDHDGRIYLSVSAVEDLAAQIGLVPVETGEARVAELEAQVELLLAELEDERRVNSAIDVLESRDFTARRKAGRPKTKTAPKEAIHG